MKKYRRPVSVLRDLIQVIPEWSSGFPYFLQFKSQFGNKEFMSHSQLPVLFLLTLQSFSIFGCKEYNQSDCGVDHLVIPCVESSLVLLEEGVCYDQCILLAKLYQLFPCFILHSKAKFACYSRCYLTSYFCIPVLYNEKDIFFGCQFYKVLQVFIEPFNFSFFSITGWGIDLNYCDIEWCLGNEERSFCRF